MRLPAGRGGDSLIHPVGSPTIAGLAVILPTRYVMPIAGGPARHPRKPRM